MLRTAVSLKKSQIKADSPPVTLAIIDLGTNSVRFDVYVLESLEKARRLHREKLMVRLGDELYVSGKLDQKAIARTIEAFDSFAKKLRDIKATKIVAFATSALRDSPEGPALIKKIRAETGIEVRLLPGLEEATLIARGILAHEEVPSGNFALIDIGGGSTEVSICRHRTVIDSFSFNLGAARLQQMFLKTAPPFVADEGHSSITDMRRYIEKMVTSVASQRKWPQIKTLLGSSGSILALRKIIKKSGGDIDPFSKKYLAQLVLKMSSMSLMDLMMVPGMEWKRADIILSGALLLEKMMGLLGAEEILTTPFALRDGILQTELEALYS